MHTLITFIVVGMFVMLPLLILTQLNAPRYQRYTLIIFYSIIAATGIIWGIMDGSLTFGKLRPESYAFNMLLHTYWINMETAFTYMGKVFKLTFVPGGIIIFGYPLLMKMLNRS